MDYSDKIKQIADMNDRMAEQQMSQNKDDHDYDRIIDLLYDRSVSSINERINHSASKLHKLVDMFYESVENGTTCDVDQLASQLGIHNDTLNWKDTIHKQTDLDLSNQQKSNIRNDHVSHTKDHQSVKEINEKVKWSRIISNVKKKQNQEKSMQQLQNDQYKKQIDQQLNQKQQSVQKNQDLQRTLELNEYFKQLEFEIVDKPLITQEQNAAKTIQKKLQRYDSVNLNSNITNKLQQLLDQNKSKFCYKLQISVNCFEKVYEFIQQLYQQSQVREFQLNNYVYSVRIDLYDDQMCGAYNSERMVHLLKQLWKIRLHNVAKFTLILYCIDIQNMNILINLIESMHYLERIELQFEQLNLDLEIQKRLYEVMNRHQKLREIYLKLGQEWKENKDDGKMYD